MKLSRLVPAFFLSCFIAGCASTNGDVYTANIEITSEKEGFLVRFANPHNDTLCMAAGTLPGPKGFIAASSDAPELILGGASYVYKKMWSGYGYQSKPQMIKSDETIEFFLKRSDFEEAPLEARLSFSPVLVSCHVFR